MIWLVLNVCFLTFALATNTAVQFDPSCSEPGARHKISEFVGQIAGNALAEEIVYRGFFSDARLVAAPASFEKRLWLWAALAILFSAAIFAVLHVPNSPMQGRYESALAIARDQAGLMFGGLFFGWLYLRTRNLFFVIGGHVLVNRHMLLIALPEAAWPPAEVFAAVAWYWRLSGSSSRALRHEQ